MNLIMQIYPLYSTIRLLIGENKSRGEKTMILSSTAKSGVKPMLKKFGKRLFIMLGTQESREFLTQTSLTVNPTYFTINHLYLQIPAGKSGWKSTDAAI